MWSNWCQEWQGFLIFRYDTKWFWQLLVFFHSPSLATFYCINHFLIFSLFQPTTICWVPTLCQVPGIQGKTTVPRFTVRAASSNTPRERELKLGAGLVAQEKSQRVVRIRIVMYSCVGCALMGVPRQSSQWGFVPVWNHLQTRGREHFPKSHTGIICIRVTSQDTYNHY